MKNFENFCQSAVVVIGISAWFGLGAMLIAWSRIPELGWFIIITPIVLMLASVAMVIVQSVREDRAEREAAAAMGKPYAKANELANQKSNPVNIAQ